MCETVCTFIEVVSREISLWYSIDSVANVHLGGTPNRYNYMGSKNLKPQACN